MSEILNKRAIFVSYRRYDSEGEAGRLFADLVKHFGEASVFMDVTAIDIGCDFRKAIDESVASCGVLLAIIGRNWVDAKNEAGQRRLDEPIDFVRLETAAALKRDIAVIPVLVQGARMPRAEQLPDDLRDLAYRNGVELTHARWASDLQVLIAGLRKYLEAPAAPIVVPKTLSAGSSPRKPQTMTLSLVVSAVIAAAALGGIYWSHSKGAESGSSLAPAATAVSGRAAVPANEGTPAKAAFAEKRQPKPEAEKTGAPAHSSKPAGDIADTPATAQSVVLAKYGVRIVGNLEATNGDRIIALHPIEAKEKSGPPLMRVTSEGKAEWSIMSDPSSPYCIGIRWQDGNVRCQAVDGFLVMVDAETGKVMSPGGRAGSGLQSWMQPLLQRYRDRKARTAKVPEAVRQSIDQHYGVEIFDALELPDKPYKGHARMAVLLDSTDAHKKSIPGLLMLATDGELLATLQRYYTAIRFENGRLICTAEDGTVNAVDEDTFKDLGPIAK